MRNWMRRLGAPAMFAALLGVLATGCDDGKTKTESPSDCLITENWNPATGRCETTSGNVGEVPPSATPVELSPNATCTVQGDMEGQFGADQMQSYLECILPGVHQWIHDTYGGTMSYPARYLLVPAGAQGTDEAKCQYDATVLQYCNGNHIIYLGEEAVWQQYSQYGDAAPVVVLAHEVTHHYQKMTQSAMPPPAAFNDLIPTENQADCGAGVYMAHAERAGILNREDDLLDLGNSLINAAEAESDKRSHGTVQERINAFDIGFASGEQVIRACNVFTPQYPIAY